jgi:hypothetical protein
VTDQPASNQGAAGAPGSDPARSGTAPIRSQKRRIRRDGKKRLKPYWSFQAHEPDEPVIVRAEGDGIGASGGRADVIGELITRVSNFYTSLSGGDPPWCQTVVFGNSVDIALTPAPSELSRIEAQRGRVSELLESGLSEDDPKVARALEDTVPNVALAATLAADLLSVEPSRAPEAAAMYGTDVAASYKALASTIVRKDIVVTQSAPTGPVGTETRRTSTIGPRKAEGVLEALRTRSKPTRLQVTVLGTLSIANKLESGFGLTFDQRAPRPSEFKGRRLLSGTYTPEVGEKMMEEGLWGRPVRATIEIERDPVVSNSRIRPDRLTLVQVESREAGDSQV